MYDQAQKLREIINDHPSNHRPTKIITVTSGKGGVGKSNFSLNFAISLIEQGQKVIIIDADLGLANLDVLMGISPKYNLSQMVEHKYSVWDIMESGPGGVEFIAGSSGFTNLKSLDDYQLNYLFEQLSLLQGYADVIIFDTGAGLSKESLHFILSSDETILITTPEPTSITDAYAIIKMVHSKNPLARTHLVVNRVTSHKEGEETAKRISVVAKQFLGMEIPLLGYIFEDRNVPKAVKIQEPFYLNDPTTLASQSIRNIVHNFINRQKIVTEVNGGIKGFMRRMLNLIR